MDQLCQNCDILVLEVTGRGPKIVEPTDQKIEDGQLEGLAHELENKLGREKNVDSCKASWKE
jgi:hypothetical protein